MSKRHSHYFKPVAGLEHIDVYRTLLLFGVTDPCLQHAIKKLLVAGGRGAKDIGQDVQEAIDTLERWKAMRQEEDQPSRRPMTPNMISYPAVEVGSDVRFDQTGRQEAVEQNGNDGAVYPELTGRVVNIGDCDRCQGRVIPCDGHCEEVAP